MFLKIYRYRNDYTKILRKLISSFTAKKRHGWKREIGCGFLAEEIESIKIISKKLLLFNFNFDRKQEIEIPELNLRETEEAIKFIRKVIK
jgi:hypothetical protein